MKYSKNYKKTVGSLYNYYRDELSDDADNNFDNIKVVNSNIFIYKNKIIGDTYNVNAGAQGYDVNKNRTQEVELAIPLKYLGNFWRALNIPLISCEVFLELKWDKNCVITSLEQRDIGGGNRDNAPTGATLAINDCKLYVPVATLSKDDEIKLLTNLKSGFKREITWNKYRSQMTTEAVNNNLNILIDATFTNVNRLFVLTYQNADDRQLFSQFYLPNVMVKDYNVIIDKLAFFDLPIKTEEEAYEKIIDISKNNEYTTGNLLDYDYFKKHYKLIAIDLSKQQVLQENEDLIQQINFIGKLEEAANVFIIIEKKENTILEFSQNLAIMENQKIINLLDKIDTDSKHFATKKWYIINDENNTNYGLNKDTGADNPDTIKYDTRVLKPNLCDYAEAYILVDGTIRSTNAVNATRLALENGAPFTKCNLEFNDEHVDTAENLDIVMPMYNLIEYSDNYQDLLATLYQYKRDEPPEADAVADLTANNSDSLKYKIKLLGNVTEVAGDAAGVRRLNVKVVIPLSNFFRSLEMPLINCKIKLNLTWKKKCVLSTGDGEAVFIINDTKLYVPVVTLSKEDNKDFIEQQNKGFQRSIYWNEYKTKEINENADANVFKYINLDPSFQGVNRLFVMACNIIIYQEFI